MPQIFAETERLILREITREDAKHLFELDSDPLVHRFLGNQPLKDISQVEPIIDHIHRQYEENGIGRWAVIEKDTGEFTGWSGLKLEDLETNGIVNYIDLGFRFIPKYWGRGYATESGLASVKYGFEQMGYDKICGAAHVDNHGSNRALQKCGLLFVNDFEYDGAMHKWYELDRDR